MKSKLEFVWATQKLWQQKNTTVMITESADIGEQKILLYMHIFQCFYEEEPLKIDADIYI